MKRCVRYTGKSYRYVGRIDTQSERHASYRATLQLSYLATQLAARGAAVDHFVFTAPSDESNESTHLLDSTVTLEPLSCVLRCAQEFVACVLFP